MTDKCTVCSRSGVPLWRVVYQGIDKSASNNWVSLYCSGYKTTETGSVKLHNTPYSMAGETKKMADGNIKTFYVEEPHAHGKTLELKP